MTLNCRKATNAGLLTPQHDLSGITAGQPGYTAARMRTRTTQKDIFYGHPVRRMPWYGAHGVELVELQRTVEDVSSNHADITLDIERRLDLSPQY